MGLGSSIWTNWARAIIVLQQLKNPPDTYVLRFAKRGNRTGIVDDDFNRLREVYIEHAQVGLSWVQSDYKPDQNPGGRPKKARWNLIENEWDGTPISTQDFRNLCQKVLAVSDRTSFRVLAQWSGTHIIKNPQDLWVKSNP